MHSSLVYLSFDLDLYYFLKKVFLTSLAIDTKLSEFIENSNNNRKRSYSRVCEGS